MRPEIQRRILFAALGFLAVSWAAGVLADQPNNLVATAGVTLGEIPTAEIPTPIPTATLKPSPTPTPKPNQTPELITTPIKPRVIVTSKPPIVKREVSPSPTSTPDRGDWYHPLDIINDEIIPVKAGESVYGILPSSKDNSRSLMEVKSFQGNNPSGANIRLWGEQKINELFARLSNKGYGNTKDGFPPDDGTVEYKNGKWTLYEGKAGFVMIKNTTKEPFSISFTVTNRGKQCDASNTRTFIGSIGKETSCWVDWWKNAEIVNP